MKIREIFIRWIYPFHQLPDGINSELDSSGSILDLGCGTNSPIQFCSKGRYTVGIDAFKKSIEESRKKGIHTEYIIGDINKIDDYVKPKSFDYVVALDLIEHLSKKEGLQLIKLMSCIARKKIIISTPNGYIEQGTIEENPLQSHRSAWYPKDFENLGFKISGMLGLKYLRGSLARIRFKPEKFWAVISTLSNIIVKRRPDFAYYLFCVRGQ